MISSPEDPSLEIVHLRISADINPLIIKQLLESLSHESHEKGFNIYRPAGLENDIMIIIYSLKGETGGGSGFLGERLSSILADYGIVNHSLWNETR